MNRKAVEHEPSADLLSRVDAHNRLLPSMSGSGQGEGREGPRTPPQGEMVALGSSKQKSLGEGSTPEPLKKKRKSPAVPWKKPKDMPKRPLSAYNLFFKAERERLIRASGGTGSGGLRGRPDAAQVAPNAVTNQAPTRPGRSSQTAGIGFAGLAKTIAAKWKNLGEAEKAPFEKQAAIDKARYDEAVAEWRLKRKKQQEDSNASKASTDSSQGNCPSSPTGQSDSSADAKTTQKPEQHRGPPAPRHEKEPYPAEWFHAGPRGQQSPSSSAAPMSEDSYRTLHEFSQAHYHSPQQRQPSFQQDYSPMGGYSNSAIASSPHHRRERTPGYGYQGQQHQHQHQHQQRPYAAVNRSNEEMPRREEHNLAIQASASSEDDLMSRGLGPSLSFPLTPNADLQGKGIQPAGHGFGPPMFPHGEDERLSSPVRQPPPRGGSYDSSVAHRRRLEECDAMWDMQLRAAAGFATSEDQHLCAAAQAAMRVHASRGRNSFQPTDPVELNASAFSRPQGIQMRSSSFPVRRATITYAGPPSEFPLEVEPSERRRSTLDTARRCSSGDADPYSSLVSAQEQHRQTRQKQQQRSPKQAPKPPSSHEEKLEKLLPALDDVASVGEDVSTVKNDREQEQQRQRQQHGEEEEEEEDEAAKGEGEVEGEEESTVQHGTSLRALTENLDADTINFISRVHFS